MTPNQFRIGNVVKYDGRIFRLHSIGEYPILDTIEFGAKVVEWKDLEPVEITEEVLRGMGFKNYQEITYRWFLKMRSPLSILVYDLDDHTAAAGSQWLDPMKYPHAHQLQNLIFSLTGEEVVITEI